AAVGDEHFQRREDRGAEQMSADGAAVPPAQDDVRVDFDVVAGGGQAAGDGEHLDLLVDDDLLVNFGGLVPVGHGGPRKGADAVQVPPGDAALPRERDQRGHDVVAVVEDQ